MLIEGKYLESLNWLENCANSTRRGKSEIIHIKIAVELINKLLSENNKLSEIINNNSKVSI